MDRIQTEQRFYFRHLLATTFRPVIRLSQWCCTAPFPMDPYQRRPSSFRQETFGTIRLLRRCISVVLFGIVVGAPLLLYLYYAGLIFAYKIPMSIKLMYYLQSLLQTVSIGYVLFVHQFHVSFHRFYFERLAYVLEKFGRRDIGVSLGALRTNVFRLMVVLLLYVVVVIVALFARDRSWPVLPKVAIFLTTQMMSMCFSLLYMILFGTVTLLLRQMNDTLEGILVGPILDQIDTHQVLGATLRLTRDDERMIEKIRLLHLKLLHVVLRTNGGAYGRLLIAILLAIFIYLNAELLQLYQGVKAGAYSFAAIGIKLINLSLKFLMLFMYAYPNRAIQKQNLRTLNVLQQLNRSGNDARCNEITNRFITQTSFFLSKGHDAYGMIPIDMSLVLNFVSGLTSIVVVLVQFSDAKAPAIHHQG